MPVHPVRTTTGVEWRGQPGANHGPPEGNTGHLSSDDNEEGHGYSSATLCGDPHPAVQKLRCEVRAVTPYDGV